MAEMGEPWPVPPPQPVQEPIGQEGGEAVFRGALGLALEDRVRSSGTRGQARGATPTTPSGPPSAGARRDRIPAVPLHRWGGAGRRVR